MGSTPKPVTPIQQTGSGIASIAAGAGSVAAPAAPKPMPPPQNYIPFQAPPAEESPIMPLSNPELAVPFSPNSSNPNGAPGQPDPRAAVLRNLFTSNRMGGR